MQKQVKNDLTYFFIYDYLYVLMNLYGSFIEEDKILYKALKTAFQRVNEIISKGSCGDIVEQYVITVYDDELR